MILLNGLTVYKTVDGTIILHTVQWGPPKRTVFELDYYAVIFRWVLLYDIEVAGYKT